MSPEMREMIGSAAAMLVCACAAFTDVKDHKIYNKLTLAAILFGFAFHFVFGGVGGLKLSGFGFLMGCLFVGYRVLGMLKAGDIKLYMAVGAITGWRFCLWTMIFSVLIGGVVAFVLMVMRKSGRTALIRLKNYLIHMVYTRTYRVYEPEDQSGYFSFGCMILLGVIASFFYLNVFKGG